MSIELKNPTAKDMYQSWPKTLILVVHISINYSWLNFFDYDNLLEQMLSLDRPLLGEQIPYKSGVSKDIGSKSKPENTSKGHNRVDLC